MAQTNTHSHDDHSHAPANFNKSFVIGIALNAGYVVFEAFFGLLGHSLALFADAGHNLSDVLASCSPEARARWPRLCPEREKLTYSAARPFWRPCLMRSFSLSRSARSRGKLCGASTILSTSRREPLSGFPCSVSQSIP